MNNDKVIQIFLFQKGKFLGMDIFVENRVMIGRDESVCQFALMSNKISRQHALVERLNDELTIKDVGSKNGVYVNDQRIAQQTKIERLDKIAIGDFVLKIKLGSNDDEDVQRIETNPKQIITDGSYNTIAAEPYQGQINPSVTNIIEQAKNQTSAPEPQQPIVSNERTLLKPVFVVPTNKDDQRTPIIDIKQQINLTTPPQQPQQPQPISQGALALAQDQAHDEEEEEEHEEAPFQPPFSLVQKLLADHRGVLLEQRSNLQQEAAFVEIISVQKEKLIGYRILQRNHPRWQPDISKKRVGQRLRALVQVTLASNNRCNIQLGPDAEGRLIRQRQEQPIGHILRAKHGYLVGELQSGDVVSIYDPQSAHYIRYVTVPTVHEPKRTLLQQLGAETAFWRTGLLALLVHILCFALLGLQMQEKAPLPDSPEFTVQTKEELGLEEPPPPPPEPEPEPPAPPSKPAAPPKRPPIKQRAKPVAVNKKPAKAPGPPGILGLLSKKGPTTAAPGPAAAVQAISNLQAVKVPGNAGSFRTSGLMGKLPSSAGISFGGGSGLVTKGGSGVLRGGAGHLGRQGSQRVEGMVQRNLGAMKTTGQGSLDRASIDRVVNSHMNEIQRCYERELAKDSTLGGKIQFEWTIQPTGQVGTIRQTTSSVASAAVARCIMDAIRSWRFPQPQGGPVIVSYPFTFNGVDF